MRALELPFHVVLAAVFTSVHLLSQNRDLFRLSNGTRVLVLNAVAALVLLAIFAAIYRSLAKGGLAATGVLIVFWTKPVFQAMLPESASQLVLVVLGLLALIVFAGLAKVGESAAMMNTFLNVGLGVALIWPVTLLAAPAPSLPAPGPSGSVVPALELDPAPRPNVVHVVLDGYARQDVLAMLGFDNGPFVARLRELGFHVADRAVTPYPQTMLAMYAILDADYL
ncbi:MAG: hypothetical protein R3190_03220, partial [Thermoanaerobaculia bacterium]|nr:hypothetical protein [Thermoanaerobaculia bacterium]